MTKAQKDAVADVVHAMRKHQKVIQSALKDIKPVPVEVCPVSTEDLKDINEGMTISLDKLERAFPGIQFRS